MPSKIVKKTTEEVKTVKMVTKKEGLLVPNYSLLGKESGSLDLPKEFFGQIVNKNLLAKALRVYMTNQKTFTASSKTRGQVRGTTRKMYSQKGTGRARHGAATAPIFVGGGIAFGPTPRVVRLSMSQGMRKAALTAALSTKALEGKVVAVSGLDKASGKTKEIVKALQGMNVKSALFLTAERMDNVVRAVKNIEKVDVLPINLSNAYEVIRHDTLVLTKEAVEKLSKVEVVK